MARRGIRFVASGTILRQGLAICHHGTLVHQLPKVHRHFVSDPEISRPTPIRRLSGDLGMTTETNTHARHSTIGGAKR